MSLLLDSEIPVTPQTSSFSMLSGLQIVTVIPSEVNVQASSGTYSPSIVTLINGTSTQIHTSSVSFLTQASSTSSSGAVYHGKNKNCLLFVAFFMILLNAGLMSL